MLADAFTAGHDPVGTDIRIAQSACHMIQSRDSVT
jgi:hypothetical protein